MVCGGVRWCAVVCGGVRWCTVVYGGVRWRCTVVYLGARWCAVRWCTMVYGSVRWFTVVRVQRRQRQQRRWCVVVYGGGVWWCTCKNLTKYCSKNNTPTTSDYPLTNPLSTEAQTVVSLVTDSTPHTARTCPHATTVSLGIVEQMLPNFSTCRVLTQHKHSPYKGHNS